jgi:hypothetical protein
MIVSRTPSAARGVWSVSPNEAKCFVLDVTSAFVWHRYQSSPDRATREADGRQGRGRPANSKRVGGDKSAERIWLTEWKLAPRPPGRVATSRSPIPGPSGETKPGQASGGSVLKGSLSDLDADSPNEATGSSVKLGAPDGASRSRAPTCGETPTTSLLRSTTGSRERRPTHSG